MVDATITATPLGQGHGSVVLRQSHIRVITTKILSCSRCDFGSALLLLFMLPAFYAGLVPFLDMLLRYSHTRPRTWQHGTARMLRTSVVSLSITSGRRAKHQTIDRADFYVLRPSFATSIRSNPLDHKTSGRQNYDSSGYDTGTAEPSSPRGGSSFSHLAVRTITSECCFR